MLQIQPLSALFATTVHTPAHSAQAPLSPPPPLGGGGGGGGGAHAKGDQCSQIKTRTVLTPTQGSHADKPLAEIPRLDLQWMLAMNVEGQELRQAIVQELAKS